ncbi:tail fiber domain-containing protein [Aeromonas caviae]
MFLEVIKYKEKYTKRNYKMAQEKVLDIIKSRKIIESAYGINLNAAQGTAANALTRRDFVEAQDSLKVSKSGDTMSGNLTVPKVLLSAAQGTEANAVARRDFVESTVTASGKGVKDLTIALPAGAPTSGYIPVLFKTNGSFNSFVFIETWSGYTTIPMNSCSFLGNVRASGWTDRGSYAVGQFTIFDASERAIHSIHGPSEADNGFVVYVETRAFPIRVRVDIETAVTAHATDATYGTSVFKVNGQVSGNTKTIVLANFDKGTGTYNGSNRVYDNGYNPTPEAVGALPVNGNAVTASRLQTARLIAGVPFDGTSNISISAANVGAVAKTGDTMTGNLHMGEAEIKFNNGTSIVRGTGDGATQNITNLQIKSWYGIGISPTAGLPAGMTMGQNSIWINARSGAIDSIGSVTAKGFRSSEANAYWGDKSGHGMTLGMSTDNRTLIGGGGSDGIVVIRPLGTGTTTAQTIFEAAGTIWNPIAPTNTAHLTNKAYVDSAIAAGDALQVSKAGDTMTGNLVAPRFNMTGSQGTSAGDAVRYDYLSGQTPLRATELGPDADLNTIVTPGFYTQRRDIADGMALNYPAPYQGVLVVTAVPSSGVSQTYSTQANGTKHKQYYRTRHVSGAWQAWVVLFDERNPPTPDQVQAVAKAGDKMTGALGSNTATGNWRIAPPGASQYGTFWHQDTSNLYLMLTNLGAQDGAYNALRPLVVNLATGAVSMNAGLTLGATQGTTAQSATRKDYVDSAIAAGDALQVSKTGDTMTGALTAPKFIESSDIRLKSDIRTIDRCLDRVNVITPYTYDKVGQDGYDAGVIAQDVAYALPEAVRDIKVEVEGEEKEMMGVSYSGLTALAIGAIKELHELVKAQQAEITELKSLIK